MIPIKDVYEAVALDNVNSAENGQLSYEMYNRLSKRAELRLLDYISGDIENAKPPIPYSSQKLRDILSPFIQQQKLQVESGKIVKPDGYYSFENMYLLGTYNDVSSCDDDTIQVQNCNTPIELLSNDKFYYRCNTFIEGLSPSFQKPIAKEVGNSFEFLPFDLGSIGIEYVRFPIYGKIVTKHDNMYNDEVIDETLSINYEYSEYARELLVYFITDMFAIHTREQALSQENKLNQKLVRG